MQADRRKKIAALLDSPVAGEREAAQAALDRLSEDDLQPAYASVEWHAAVQEWCRKIQFCVSRLGSSVLSDADIVLIRNWGKGRGDPWQPGAELLLAIYRKLVAADARK